MNSQRQSLDNEVTVHPNQDSDSNSQPESVNNSRSLLSYDPGLSASSTSAMRLMTMTMSRVSIDGAPRLAAAG